MVSIDSLMYEIQFRSNSQNRWKSENETLMHYEHVHFRFILSRLGDKMNESMDNVEECKSEAPQLIKQLRIVFNDRPSVEL